MVSYPMSEGISLLITFCDWLAYLHSLIFTNNASTHCSCPARDVVAFQFWHESSVIDCSLSAAA